MPFLTVKEQVRERTKSVEDGAAPAAVFGFKAKFKEAVSTARRRKTVTIVLSIYLLLLAVMPSNSYKVVEALGVKFQDLEALKGSVALGLAVIVAHLSGLLADGARIARSMGKEVEIGFDAGDKFSLSVALGDGVDESRLFAATDGHPKTYRRFGYWLSRVADRLIAYTIFLFVLGLGYFCAARGAHDALTSAPNVSNSVLTVWLATAAFIVLGLFRLAQYWVIRFDGLVARLSQLLQTAGTSELKAISSLDPPRKVSLTSILLYTFVLTTVILADVLVKNAILWKAFRPGFWLLFLPWRKEILQGTRDRWIESKFSTSGPWFKTLGAVYPEIEEAWERFDAGEDPEALSQRKQHESHRREESGFD